MAHQVTLEEAANTLPQLVREAQSGQEIIFAEGRRPVARLVPLAEDEVSSTEIARLAVAGGAFNWLAEEPDTYYCYGKYMEFWKVSAS